MKKIATIGTIAVLGAGLVGCTPGNNVPGATFAGAAGGGLLGAAIFDSPLGILGGALLGGVIGNFVGKSMDENDRARMAQAVTTTPVGQEATWTNKKDVTYTVRPVRQYHPRGNPQRYCREYQTTVEIGGKTRRAYGRACRMPDGQWKMIK